MTHLLGQCIYPPPFALGATVAVKCNMLSSNVLSNFSTQNGIYT